LSSLFPYGPGADGKIIYSVKRPLISPPADPAILRDKGKAIKKLDYINMEDLPRWLGDRPLTGDELSAISNIKEFMGGSEGEEDEQTIGNSEKREKMSKWWTVGMRPRVALDRQFQSSSIWFCAALHFAEGAGLYGIASVADDQWLTLLDQAFRLLGDLGIGGEKTYGMGMFSFSGFHPAENGVPLSRFNSTKYILLSAYYPNGSEKESLADSLMAWDYFESKGYIVSGRNATTLKRKRVNFIAEGSVFSKSVRGAMVDVTPDGALDLGLNHPVYRCGLAFMLP
jgi:CRISPR-associated protein Csm4